MPSKFVHLHLHTKYSLLDGMCKFDEIIASSKKYDMHAVAITDHGNMYGAVEFYDTVRKAGIKPIIGMETYIVDDIKMNKEKKIREKYHLILLAKNEEGYKNLIKLSSFGFTEGFYYKPTIDKKFLVDHASGLIALSSCMQGEVPALIISNDMSAAKEAAIFYRNTFGEENFYLELQNHGIEEELVAKRGLMEISRELSIPTVATNDAHYMKKEDSKAHEILTCIQTATTLKEEDRFKFSSGEIYFKNYEEMAEVMPDALDAIERTVDISHRCNFEFSLNKKYFMPSYDTGVGGKPYEDFLEDLTKAEFPKRYPQASAEATARLEHELAVIKKMGYSGYFLIIREIIEYARSQNIPVGPGRGSAAGSLVAYVLGITNIEPLRYGLLFERFLNPDRISPPDIDTDFSDEERDKIINFIVEKFGKDKVAQIITFQTLKAKQAIRDVGRVLDVPLKIVDELAKKVPEKLNITLNEALADKDFNNFVNNDETRKKIVDFAMRIEGLLRQDSTHAAGVVIAPEALINFVPLSIPKEKDTRSSELNYMTQYPMESLEKIGLLKFDILGLRNLSIIKNTLEIIKNETGAPIALPDSDFSEKEVFTLLAAGNTIGVFQLESPGMRDILVKIKPEGFEEIIAIISLFRPGPMEMIDTYIKRKKGIEKIPDKLPENMPELKETYGIAIYQEQVMQIAVKVAGFTMAEADNLRRAMSKKKISEMEKIGKKFMEGAVSRGMKKTEAQELFDKLEQFSQYGFNKSHAAAYAVLSYQTAYLKTFYTLEYMSALLTSVIDNHDKLSLFAEDCKKNAIKIMPPDVNHSEAFFGVERGMIRFGLAAIKNVGLAAAEDIVKTRLEKGAFTSIFDFCKKVNLRLVNSKTMESLVKAGAFDFTLFKRAQLFEIISLAMKKSEFSHRDDDTGQSSLFEAGTIEDKEEMPSINEWPDGELLSYEKELLGTYISSHPLASYDKLIKNTTMPISEVVEGRHTKKPYIIVGGVTHELKKRITYKGDERMDFYLEDLSGRIKILINEKLTKEKQALFKNDQMFMIRGKMNLNSDEPALNADSVITLDEAYKVFGQYLHINMREPGLDDTLMQELKNTLALSKGTTIVILHLTTAENKVVDLEFGPENSVKLSEQFLSTIETLIGEDNWWISHKK
ncbi:MAG: DNA polymerase III subunit alpha [bacterium]